MKFALEILFLAVVIVIGAALLGHPEWLRSWLKAIAIVIAEVRAVFP